MPPLYLDRKPIPDTVKRAVRERAGNCCEECGDDGRLEFHHLTYLNTNSNYHRDWFGLIFGAETPEDLMLLCRECHHQQHRDFNGNFWADPDDHPERNIAYLSVLQHLSCITCYRYYQIRLSVAD